MKIIWLVIGIVAGLFAITLVAESIEFTTVWLVSGESVTALTTEQEMYFAIRNQWGILLFKGVYNLLAAVVGGYVTAWIAGFHRNLAAYILIAIQSLSLIWAGFFSELASTGPTWMWIMLLIVTPIGIYAGYRFKAEKQTDGNV